MTVPLAFAPDEAEPPRGECWILRSVDEHRDHVVAVASRHQDDVDPPPAADPGSLAMQDHVIRSRARCAQDRRPGPVPSERDAGAAIAPAEGGEPLVAEARRIARRDGSDRVPMLEPHERGGQAPEAKHSTTWDVVD